MKKSAIAILAATAAASTGAYAQSSSVTLFGVMDLGARMVRNDDLGSVKSLVSGSNQTSRIGLRGVEDLGGGLSAGFHLESTAAADIGTAGQSTPAGQFWDRRATVSLISKPAGELRLGRDYVPSYNNWARFDPFGHVGIASAGNFVSATPNGPIRAAFGSAPNTTSRSSNSIQYLLPAGWGGVQGGVMLAAREGGTAANGQHKVLGARLGYGTTALLVSAAYTQTENDVTAADKFTDTALGASYDFGVLRASAAVRQFKFRQAKQRDLLVGLVAPIGNGQINASFQRADASGFVGASTSIEQIDADQWALGYVHSLSKRTALYTTVARINNKSGASYAISGGPSGLAAGRNSTGFELGVRHNF